MAEKDSNAKPAKGKVIHLGKSFELEARRRQRNAEIKQEYLSIFAEAIDLDTGQPVGEERAKQLVDGFYDHMADAGLFKRDHKKFSEEAGGKVLDITTKGPKK